MREWIRMPAPGGFGGLGALGDAARPRPHRRAEPGLRVPDPRPRRVLREHGRPHHLAAPRPGATCSSTRGACGGRRSPPPTCARSTPTPTCVAGRWDVTPAIHIHTELHRRRPDARVVIHNHPYWVTVMAAVGMLPEILHQNGSMFFGDLDFVNEYTGEVDSAELGRRPGHHDRRRQGRLPRQPRHHRHRRRRQGRDLPGRHHRAHVQARVRRPPHGQGPAGRSRRSS